MTSGHLENYTKEVTGNADGGEIAFGWVDVGGRSRSAETPAVMPDLGCAAPF